MNNLRFPGQYYDAETGLNYNYFRDYNPVIGRYVQADPIGLRGGINLYTYVGNNPVNGIDPLGLFIWPSGFWTGGGNGGYGQMTGQVIGTMVGAYAGAQAGTVIGGSLGITVGAAIGSLAGAPGVVVGVVVGGGVGGTLGAMIGGFTGGFAGGTIGGATGRSLFDPSCAGRLNCGEPDPGRCPYFN